jgi:hypothetical protein
LPAPRPSRNRIIPGDLLGLELSMRASTTYRGPICLSGGFHLPAISRITLGGGFRLPDVKPAGGKITLGGGFRLPASR